MAITRVGGAANTSGTTGVTTLSVTYSPTSGNVACVMVGFGSGPPSSVTVKDNLGNTLTDVVDRTNGNYQRIFSQVTVPSGVTGYTVTTNQSVATAIAVEEYSGAAGVISGSTGATGSGTSATATTNAPSAGDVVLIAFAAAPTVACTSGGTIENSANYGSTFTLAATDTTAASAGNVSSSFTFGSSPWGWCSVIVGGPGKVRASQDIILVVTKPTTALSRVTHDLLLTANKVTSASARVAQDLVLVADKRNAKVLWTQDVILVAAASRHIALWSQDVILVAVKSPIVATQTTFYEAASSLINSASAVPYESRKALQQSETTPYEATSSGARVQPRIWIYT